MSALSVAEPAPLSVLSLWRALALRWAALQRRQRDRQALSEMSPRELCDLGLGRGEIDYLTAGALHGRSRNA